MITAAATPFFALAFGSDVSSWSTPTRLPELLAGAALASWLVGRSVPQWAARRVLPALAVIVAASMLLPTNYGPAYTGFLGVFALASAVLILGLQGGSRAGRR